MDTKSVSYTCNSNTISDSVASFPRFFYLNNITTWHNFREIAYYKIKAQVPVVELVVNSLKTSIKTMLYTPLRQTLI